MPNLTLTDDELEAVLTMRNRANLVMGHCEDYPCCGHTPDDPCTREWFDAPGAFDPQKNPHCFCEHEAGMCYVDEYEDDVDPATCEHGDTSTWRGHRVCDVCDSRLMMVTDVSPLAYESRVIPGMWMEIRIIGVHWEVAS